MSYDGHQVSLDGRPAAAAPGADAPTRRSGSAARDRSGRCRSIARYADYWHVAGAGGYAALADRLATLAAEAGRDAAAIRRAGSLSLSEAWPEVEASIEKAVGRGFDYLICGWPGEGPDRITEFAETVMPKHIG